MSDRAGLVYGLCGVVGVVFVWETTVRLGAISATILSSPTAVLSAVGDLWAEQVLGPALASSAQLFAVGFGTSLACGLVLGVVLGWCPRMGALINPWISVVSSTPRIALVPLVMVWAGIDMTARVVIIALFATFPIVISTAAGVASTERDYLLLGRSYLANSRQMLWSIVLPGAVPAIMAGVRQGMLLGLLAVVVAEYFVGGTGIGGLIYQSSVTLRTDRMLAGTAVLSATAIALSAALRRLEARLDRWRTT